MSKSEEIRYALDFRANRGSLPKNPAKCHSSATNPHTYTAPRIARLMALAIRFDGLLRAEEFRDYAEIARLGQVTRARMTQIMKLLNLAPEIQEQILFLSAVNGLNEKNLRPVTNRINWHEQRSLFQKILSMPRGNEHRKI